MNSQIYQSPLGEDRVCNCWLSRGAGTFRSHWHSEIEIIYVLDGTAVVMAEGKRYTLTSNQLVIFGSAEIHEIVSTSDNHLRIVMEMGYHLLGKLFRVFTEIEFEERILSLEAHSELQAPIFELLERIKLHLTQNIDNQSDIVTLRTHALLYDLAVTLLECCRYRRIDGDRSHRIGRFLEMYNIIEYVRAHYGEQLDVAHVAKLAGYENTRFCQLFKRAIGISFHRYLSEYRVEEAKRLLGETGLPISRVAESVGIPETKTFTRLFKAIVGVPPTVYRKQNR